MGILYRYIIAEILKHLFPIWLALGFIMFVLEWLAQVFGLKTSAWIGLLLYLYKVPSHLQLTFPIAALFSVLVVVGGMNRAREVVAAQAMGIRRWTFLFAVVLAVVIASVPNYFVMNHLNPWGMKNHYELYDAEVLHVPSRFSLIRREKMWYRNRDVLYNVGYFAQDKNEIFDLTIYTFDDDFHVAQTIYAKKAAWNGTNWVLSEGRIALTDKRLRTPVIEEFKTRSTRLIEEPRNLKRVEREADTMDQAELKGFIDRNRSLGINTAKWEVVLHGRYSFMLVPFILLLLAFPVALRFRRTGGLAQDGVLVATVSLAYWMIYNFGMTLGGNGKVLPWLAAWGPSGIFLVAVIIYNQTRNLRTESA